MVDNKSSEGMFRIWRMTAHVIGVSSVLAGVLTSNMLIGLIGVGTGIIILISARQRYRVVTYDERTIEISRRAASAAFRVFAIGLLALYILNRYVYPFIGTMSGEAVGDWLAILVCSMLYCHLGFYAYYRWRM
jgi:uncharacterized membrane protein